MTPDLPLTYRYDRALAFKFARTTSNVRLGGVGPPNCLSRGGKDAPHNHSGVDPVARRRDD